MSEEELQREVEAQARRVQAEDNLASQTSLEDNQVITEQELSLAKQEQELIRKYSEESTD